MGLLLSSSSFLYVFLKQGPHMGMNITTSFLVVSKQLNAALHLQHFADLVLPWGLFVLESLGAGPSVIGGVILPSVGDELILSSSLGVGFLHVELDVVLLGLCCLLMAAHLALKLLSHLEKVMNFGLH